MIPKKFIISPPFGRFFKNENATSVKGSFTVNYREGLVIQALKTLRPVRNGWVNKIGLRNKGIRNVRFDKENIFSLASIEYNDWERMLDIIPENIAVEINLGCPNVEHLPISAATIRAYREKCSFISVKLPPLASSFDAAEYVLDSGVQYLHLCNTLPTTRGGESGNRLRPKSLEIISEIRKWDRDFYIIGGGGIYTVDHVKMYEDAGADHFSLATTWFNPFKAWTIINHYCPPDLPDHTTFHYMSHWL